MLCFFAPTGSVVKTYGHATVSEASDDGASYLATARLNTPAASSFQRPAVGRRSITPRRMCGSRMKVELVQLEGRDASPRATCSEALASGS